MADLVWQNFKMRQGDDKKINVTIKDENGDVIDITSFTATYKIATALVDGTVKVTKTVGSGITLTDPTSGVLQIVLVPADTSMLMGQHYHELELVDTGSLETTVLVGYIEIWAALI
tara:strand:- start:63 stop:410 length:348 start_codon:yes stop_codon:yes gene_type:complete